MAKNNKTNVMRLLEQNNIDYVPHEWLKAEGERPATDSPVYKTLLTVGKSKDHYVFVIPVDHELDLKKAASAVGEKNIHMTQEKELRPLTGYVHGGCSPLGMKKEYKTTFDSSALDNDQIVFSAGKVGFSVEVDPRAIESLLDMQFADVKTDE